LGSQPLFEFFDLHFDVLKDLAQQSWFDRFASMNWNDCRAPIRMPQVVMAPFDSEDIESCSPQGRDHLAAAQAWQPRHTQTAMRCTPMNSVAGEPSPSASRQSNAASRTRFISFSL
jgi:hypothetical protein